MINSIVFLNKNDQVQMCDNESYKYNWISTIRFTLVSDNHTLSSEEINDDLERLISEFERSGYIVKR